MGGHQAVAGNIWNNKTIWRLETTQQNRNKKKVSYIGQQLETIIPQIKTCNVFMPSRCQQSTRCSGSIQVLRQPVFREGGV